MLFFTQNCDKGYVLVASWETILGSNCKDKERSFILTRKFISLENHYDTLGKITGIGTSEIKIKLADGQIIKVDQNGDFISLFSGALGSLPEWARLKIVCPSSGYVVFDSGVVKREDAFCESSDRSLYGAYWFFGLKKNFDELTCCPKGFECSKFLKK